MVAWYFVRHLILYLAGEESVRNVTIWVQGVSLATASEVLLTTESKCLLQLSSTEWRWGGAEIIHPG